ncbi:hypothetical protein RIF29_41889 [Crotalaria pallida]|uniref:Uncharacterized protein n=1 Tax=Crotalaria pallida TaxID=3830 RepID=A0AAN9E8V7_CROPI
MAATIKIVSVFLFLGLISQGYGQECTLKDLSVKVAKSGAQIKGKAEWVVTITNKCNCAQNTVKLNCKGFKTVVPIDPAILRVSGNVCLVNYGYGQECTLKDLSVKVAKSGAQIKGKPEWVVTITNNCVCVQSNVKVNCRGFQTEEPIDPLILIDSGDDECIVNYGNAIYEYPITFKYAWDNSFPFNPVSSEIACS